MAIEHKNNPLHSEVLEYIDYSLYLRTELGVYELRELFNPLVMHVARLVERGLEHLDHPHGREQHLVYMVRLQTVVGEVLVCYKRANAMNPRVIPYRRHCKFEVFRQILQCRLLIQSLIALEKGVEVLGIDCLRLFFQLLNGVLYQ